LGIGALILTRKIGLAILGFAIGSLIDQYQQAAKTGQSGAGTGAGYGQDPFDFYRRQSSMHDLPTMLMALSAAVMKADGKVLRTELDYVKNFFSAQFGKQFNATHLQTLKQFLDAPSIPLQDICNDIRNRMTQEVRVQLVHYLFGIAKADGDVGAAEINVISRIATMLGIPAVEFESLRNMFYRNVDSDYKILGIDEKATDDEVKKAYRKMAVAHHPDKVAHMGEEYLKGAKEKFQQIQDAYEAIKKRRGIK
jgi:DnaJ like chaperone protein